MLGSSRRRLSLSYFNFCNRTFHICFLIFHHHLRKLQILISTIIHRLVLQPLLMNTSPFRRSRYRTPTYLIFRRTIPRNIWSHSLKKTRPSSLRTNLLSSEQRKIPCMERLNREASLCQLKLRTISLKQIFLIRHIRIHAVTAFLRPFPPERCQWEVPWLLLARI